VTQTSPAPLSGQNIGEAARAVNRLLIAILDEAGITFEEWVALRTLALDGSAVRRDALRQNLAENLDTDPASIVALLDQLASAGMVHETSDTGDQDAILVELTPDGDALYQRLLETVGRTSARLYSGLDPNDLAATRRVLVEVTERAKSQVAR
jgi:DNA-binding MarR family transcriptional regulator